MMWIELIEMKPNRLLGFHSRNARNVKKKTKITLCRSSWYSFFEKTETENFSIQWVPTKLSVKYIFTEFNNVRFYSSIRWPTNTNVSTWLQFHNLIATKFQSQPSRTFWEWNEDGGKTKKTKKRKEKVCVGVDINLKFSTGLILNGKQKLNRWLWKEMPSPLPGLFVIIVVAMVEPRNSQWEVWIFFRLKELFLLFLLSVCIISIESSKINTSKGEFNRENNIFNS